MKLRKTIKVPTGHICITEGQSGLLEFLSIGDYGKEKNLKADFLGLTKEIDGVPHGDLLPLEEKWVVTISTQYGCSMNCIFCDVPKVGPGYNVSIEDLVDQVRLALSIHPEVKFTKRLNIHLARMGEPTWNPYVLDAIKWMKINIDQEYKIHPVISTMMPCCNQQLKIFIQAWMRMKNGFLGGEAGLQISINTTDEALRTEMFAGNACSLKTIHDIMDGLVPEGRKITLNFAYHPEYEIDADELLKWFSPDHYLCKITPMHKTQSVIEKQLETPEMYRNYYDYRDVEERLKAVGFDVIVFVPSVEEDESRITCGNAILATAEGDF